MKQVVSWGMAVLFVALAGADASAQGKLTGFAGIGVASPMGDLKDADSTKTGILVQAGLAYPIIDQRLNFRLDAGMGGAGREGNFKEQAVFWTLNTRLEYWLPKLGEKLQPYVLGGIGYLIYKRLPGQTGLDDQYDIERYTTVGGGAGIDYSLGATSLFLEAKYEVGSDDRSYVPILIGARWRGSSN